MIVKTLPLLLVILNCYHAMANCGISGCVQRTSNLPCQTNVCDIKTSCDDNLILYLGKCLTLDMAQCPFNTVLQKGLCIAETVNCTGDSCKDDKPKIICPEGSHLEGNTCFINHAVECPSNYNKINGACVHDGSCPTGTFKYNKLCYFSCPGDSEFVNGTCILTINSTSHAAVPYTIINNYTNIVNLTNILNHTNVYNIITSTNQTGGNNLNLSSLSDSYSNNGQSSKPEKSMKTNCCHITEPTMCKEIKGKKVCYNRKKQVCGKECDGQEEEDYLEIEDKEDCEKPEILVQPHPPYIILVRNQSSVPPITVHRPPLVLSPIIVQEPPIQRPHIFVQEPQIQRPQILIQRPQIRPQIIVQQLQTERPQILVQQPQILRQPHIIYQQPHIVQQPQIMQYVVQQPQASQMVSATGPCAYQSRWPFVRC